MCAYICITVGEPVIKRGRIRIPLTSLTLEYFTEFYFSWLIKFLINSCFHIGRVMIHNITATFRPLSHTLDIYQGQYENTYSLILWWTNRCTQWHNIRKKLQSYVYLVYIILYVGKSQLNDEKKNVLLIFLMLNYF
jgi:hypothetical protein